MLSPFDIAQALDDGFLSKWNPFGLNSLKEK